MIGILIEIGISAIGSAIGLKICAIAARIRKYNSIINKKKKKHDKIVLLPKTKLNSIKVLICKALIDSNTSHDEFVLINHVLKEHVNMTEEIKNLKTSSVQWRFWCIYETMVCYCLKCRKNTKSKNSKVLRTKKGRIILLWRCDACDSKKPKFIKEQEASGSWSSLVIKTPLIPLIGPLLF